MLEMRRSQRAFARLASSVRHSQGAAMANSSENPTEQDVSPSTLYQRGAWGCFAATYVCILLSMLLFPALLLDYVFMRSIVEEPVSVKEPLHFDYTLPHPVASISVHGSAGTQKRHEHARAIPIAHKVHITLVLTLPDSRYNRNLGMFQISAELLSENGQIIKSSSRPCMLPFYSAPIRLLKFFLVSLPSLMGVSTETQTLVVHFMEFKEQQVATKAVRILLQPKAGMPLGQGIPEIYSADIHVESHLPWMKNLMRNWKWTAYIWTGLLLYVMEVVFVICCCRRALSPRTWMGGQNEEGNKAEQLGESTPVEVLERGSTENVQPRKRAPVRQHSLNEQVPTARAILDHRERELQQGESQSSN